MRRARAVRIGIYQLCKTCTQPKTCFVLLLLLLYAVIFAAPVADFAQEKQRAVSALGVFPVLASAHYPQMLLMMGVVLLFSDAPFWDANQKYILLRADWRAWSGGQVLYVLVTMALYLLAVNLFCWLVMLPNIVFSTDWEKIWPTLALQSFGEIDYSVAPALIRYFSALEAWCLSMLLTWLAGCSMGLLMLFVNAHTRSKAGLILAGTISLTNLTIWNSLLDTNLYYLSPVSLANLAVVDIVGGSSGYPSLQYAVIALTIVVMVLVGLNIGLAGRLATKLDN